MNAPPICLTLLALGGCAIAAREAAPPGIPDEAPATAEAQEVVPPAAIPPAMPHPCPQCGVIKSIRSVDRDRADRRAIPNYWASEQYLSTRRYSEPTVGPIVGFTFGPGRETKTFVGAAGPNTMRQSELQIVYEITVRFDDGRLGLIEQDSIARLHVGDRIRLVNNHVELAPPEAPAPPQEQPTPENEEPTPAKAQ
ncbi:MAG TPA: hypothetical protein VFB54_10520 [Burkholderiales bacterium]|nr:hypothetical protein [Burkholderiales bacterium]